jgi:hypothetical protein
MNLKTLKLLSLSCKGEYRSHVILTRPKEMSRFLVSPVPKQITRMLHTDNYTTTLHLMFDYGTGWHFAIWSAPSEQCRYTGRLKYPNKPNRSQSPFGRLTTTSAQPGGQSPNPLLQTGRLKPLNHPDVKSFKTSWMLNLNIWKKNASGAVELCNAFRP